MSLVYLVQLVAEAGACLSVIGSDDSEYAGSEPMIYHPQAVDPTHTSHGNYSICSTVYEL